MGSPARYTVEADGRIEPAALQHVGCQRDARAAVALFVKERAGRGAGAVAAAPDDPRQRHADRLAAGQRVPGHDPDNGIECDRCVNAAVDALQAQVNAQVEPQPRKGRKAPKNDADLIGNMRQIGGGAFRTAYHRPDSKWIYKVSHYHARNGKPVADDNKYNEGEYREMMDRKTAGQTWAPPVGIWYVDGIAVIAMPYYPQDGRNADDRQRAMVHGLGLPDMHGGNYRLTVKGRLRVTDLGPVQW